MKRWVWLLAALPMVGCASFAKVMGATTPQELDLAVQHFNAEVQKVGSAFGPAGSGVAGLITLASTVGLHLYRNRTRSRALGARSRARSSG